MDGSRCRHVQTHTGVQPCGFQQLLAEGSPELGHFAAELPAGVGDDLADERVSVGMQARGRHGHQDVAAPNPVRTEDLAGLHDSRGRTRHVVVVRAHQTGVLRGLSAQQRHTNGLAGLRHAPDDIGDAFGHHPAAGDVVGHEQWAGTHHDDVVHHHGHQILPDGVVDAQRLRDRDLGSDAVRGGGEQRPAVLLERGDIHQPGEAPDAPEDCGGHRPSHGCLHEVDRPVPRRGVHSGRRVCVRAFGGRLG